MAIVFSVKAKNRSGQQKLKIRNLAYVAAHSAYNQVLFNILTSMFTSYGLRYATGGRPGGGSGGICMERP